MKQMKPNYGARKSLIESGKRERRNAKMKADPPKHEPVRPDSIRYDDKETSNGK